MKKVALIGAGGKMGFRLSKKMKDNPNYALSYVEISPAGIERLKGLGLGVTPMEDAVPGADYVVLAVPDKLIGKISTQVTKQMKPGAVLLSLDPAATYAGVIPVLDHLKYAVVHPNHPYLYYISDDVEKMKDYFGEIADQDVVCTLVKGEEGDREDLEIFVRALFAPVIHAYWITVEQMAILEPGMVELVNAPLIYIMRQALENAIRMGIPREIATSFCMGHLRAQIAIYFGLTDTDVSDGAKVAQEKALKVLMKPDWMEKTMNIESIRQCTREITDAIKI